MKTACGIIGLCLLLATPVPLAIWHENVDVALGLTCALFGAATVLAIICTWNEESSL